jgi:hypothetical protein
VLSAEAVRESVELWVVPADDAEPYPLAPSAWAFDPTANAVRVDEAVGAGAELVLLYERR